MSGAAVSEQSDVSSVGGSPGQKRKRELESPGTQRQKRGGAPPAAMSADTAAFIENAIEATHAAAAAANGVSVADFNALQAAAADHAEAAEAANASDAINAANAASATSTAQAALGMYPTLHVPPSTEEQFAAQAVAEEEQQQQQHHHHSTEQNFHHADLPLPAMIDPSGGDQQALNGLPPAAGHRYSGSGSAANANSNKPAVGSEEWHKMRKDNHKEVERRRRETINEGINELAKIVPGCEKNKGSILQRTVSFISQLKENEQQNIEKWTLEKLLTEQAITELSASNDKLKRECERLYRELETWKRVAQNAGLEPPQPKEEPGPSTSS
ncbi:hypothetical protein E4U57_001288 [Claviceps arundinis]|uniref:BHLH domain-containing protein n=1 Tax=Claviceps arundinis TaxID=1623583 RepID=A0A9P7MTC8_9HYPO|nr:hypothetical protein E4U57_001288 [Claviceps arundinis]KAG5967705.1 hypothetical protein E4U56_000686 [Claviceps arundinis]